MAKARAGIEKLVHLTPQTARVLVGGQEEHHPRRTGLGGRSAPRPPRGNRPGGRRDSSPAQTSINQAVMTGESLPVDKDPGRRGIQRDGQPIRLLRYEGDQGGGGQLHPADDPPGAVGRRGESEDCRHCRPVGHLDCCDCPERGRLDLAGHRGDHPGGDHSGRLLPLRPGAWPPPPPSWPRSGTPPNTASSCAEGDALERLASVSKITFDKTGTLTYGDTAGRCQVHSFLPDHFAKEDAVPLTRPASNSRSEHPLGKAIVVQL